MGALDWLGSKVAKYGLGFKGVTSKDVKIIRKYFPISEMQKLTDMTEKDAYKLYHKATPSDLERLIEIMKMNKKQIVKQFKTGDVELTIADVNNVIKSLENIVKAKQEKKSKKEQEKMIKIMLKTFQRNNPEWFNENNFKEDTVLRF